MGSSGMGHMGTGIGTCDDPVLHLLYRSSLSIDAQ